MIAVDTNLLVYAHRVESAWHQRANACLSALAAGSLPWAIPWPCIREFLGVVTNGRIYEPASPLDLAIKQAEFWLETPGVTMLGVRSGYWPALRDVLLQSQVVGPRVHDAHIAALCRNHGVSELWTADRDFRRFKALRVVNPLIDT